MPHRFDVLDSFRGLAAILVVFVHMHYVGSFIEPDFFRESFLFVEFFFVLSGFVLAHGYALKTNLNFKKFIISRSFRLFPLHLFTLTIIVLLEFGKLYAYNKGFNFNAVPFTGSQNPHDILPSALLLQAWLPGVETFSWNAPSWSISIEFYMYMLFFISLYINKPYFYIAWFTISILSFSILFTNTNIPLGDLAIARGLSSFFAGSLIYFIFRKVHTKVTLKKELFTLLELSVLVLVIITVSSSVPNKSIVATFLFIIQVFIFAFQKGYISKFLCNKVFLYLGKLSYSIYLTHSIILFGSLSIYMIVEKVFKIKVSQTIDEVRFIDLGGPLYNNMAILAILGIVVFISHFSYKHIELKGQALGKRINLKGITD